MNCCLLCEGGVKFDNTLASASLIKAFTSSWFKKEITECSVMSLFGVAYSYIFLYFHWTSQT